MPFCQALHIVLILFITIVVDHDVIGQGSAESGSGCKGLPKEQILGTKCGTWNFSVHCGGSFPPGTNLYFKCREPYIPETGDQNFWKNSTCNGNHWSNQAFPLLRCAKDSNWYCSEAWVNAGAQYNAVHYNVMMAMYILGSTTNIVNIAVLTRKTMRNPLNTILTALAFTDFLFILNGLITESLRLYRQDHGNLRSSYQQVVETLISQVAYYLSHTWSIYLTLLVAIWRYIGIWRPLQSRRWCVSKTAKWAICTAIVFGTILLIIIYGGSRIELIEGSENQSYQAVHSDLALKMLFWTYAIFVKLIPCTMLAGFTIGLVWGLMKAKRIRTQLKESPTNRIELTHIAGTNEHEAGKLEFDRTTKTLLVILLIFLVTEIPDGIVSILYLVMPVRFSKECLVPTVNFCFFLEQMSCVLSLFVYVIMSQAYRSTLLDILGVRSIVKPKVNHQINA